MSSAEQRSSSPPPSPLICRLRELPALTALDLSATGVTAEALGALVPAALEATQLSTLSLAHNPGQ